MQLDFSVDITVNTCRRSITLSSQEVLNQILSIKVIRC